MVMKSKLFWISMFVVCVVFIFIMVKNTSKVNDIVSVEGVISSEKMLEDFEFVTETIFSIHPDPLRNFEGDWEVEVNRLRESLKDPLTIDEFLLQLQQFVSKIGDAHTLVTTGENGERRILPIMLNWVEDELVVTKSLSSNFELGESVIRIGKLDVEVVNEKLGKFVSAENQYWSKQMVSQLLLDETYLKFLDVVEEGEVPLTVKGQNGETRVELVEPLSLERIMALRDQDKNAQWYGWEIFEEEQVGYYFLSQCIVSEGYEKSVTDFFKNVIEQNINKVVLDLRDNGGGNSHVMYPFLQHLPVKFIREFEVQLKYSEEASNQNGYEQKSGKEAFAGRLHKNVIKEPTFNGELYVLVNNRTFSAATDFATIIHDNSLGIVVGEPTGGAPSAFGDLILVDVPNSKFILAVSHKEFLRPNKSFLNDNTLHPNILIKKTTEDIHKQQDKYLQRVLEVINNN